MVRRARLTVVFSLLAILAGSFYVSPASAHSSHGSVPMACDFGPSQRGIPCSELNRAVHEAANEFRLDHARFRRMIACESHYDPQASNGTYHGLTQQGAEFWNRWAPRFNAAVAVDLGAGRPHASRSHPWDNARLAAFVIDWYQDRGRSGYTEWECKGN